MDTTTFSVSPNADINGTFLLCDLPGVTAAGLRRAFGPPNRGCVDPDKGYEGDEWSFRASNGDVFNVYSRWGQFRIGGRSSTAKGFISAAPSSLHTFRDWLEATLAR